MTSDPGDASPSVVHQIHVGEALVENVDGHAAARTDSPQFVDVRAAVQAIVGTLSPNPYGPLPIQAHHGGSVWLYDGKMWRLVLNWAGVEWSAQFCCDPARVEALRQNAEGDHTGVPRDHPGARKDWLPGQRPAFQSHHRRSRGRNTRRQHLELVLPIPQMGHTGSVSATTPLGTGVHNYPEPMCAIPRVMHADFVPFVVDPGSGAVATVAPVAPRGSGDGRVRVLFAEKGHPLAGQHEAAHGDGAAVVLGAANPTAKAAFANQA